MSSIKLKNVSKWFGKNLVIKNDTIQLVKKNGMAEYFDPITGIGLGGRDFSWTAAIHLELLKDEIDINSKHNFVNNKNVIN